MKSANQSLIDRDLSHLWHPCTQMKDHEQMPLIPIKRGQGVWLEDYDGHRYLDAVSSWWVNLFGHANPRINQALCEQLDQLEHVIFAGFTHEVGVSLAEKLVEATPDALRRCFYADNGSSAVEVALKMSFHYWKNRGQPQKTKYVTLSNSYHGETLGALAVGNVALYKETYGPLLMDVITVPSPDCYHRETGESWQAYSERQFIHMQDTLEQRADEVSAVIVEPLIQCAGSMRMYDPIYLSRLREACDKANVHLIADEVAVGFGRTGTLFACEQAGISPDFMCLSKGLTAGYLPLSAVLTTQPIYDAFYDDYATLKAFLHSHSYTGNPLACRVACEVLDIFKEDNTLEHNKTLIKRMAQAFKPLENHPHVSEVRQCGMVIAVEMVANKQDKTPFAWQERRGVKVYQYALSQGVLLRPLGNVVYCMPPYVITPEQIDWIAQVAATGIDLATRGEP